MRPRPRTMRPQVRGTGATWVHTVFAPTLPRRTTTVRVCETSESEHTFPEASTCKRDSIASHEVVAQGGASWQLRGFHPFNPPPAGLWHNQTQATGRTVVATWGHPTHQLSGKSGAEHRTWHKTRCRGRGEKRRTARSSVGDETSSEQRVVQAARRRGRRQRVDHVVPGAGKSRLQPSGPCRALRPSLSRQPL